MRQMLRQALPEPGGGGEVASNKYTFCKVLQLGFHKSCFPKDSLVLNACTFASFCKYTFAKHLGFQVSSFQKYVAGFRKLSRIFTNIVLQCFAIFCKHL